MALSSASKNYDFHKGVFKPVARIRIIDRCGLFAFLNGLLTQNRKNFT